MAYVQVPKDLTRVKSKFLLNLTKRQCLCFGLAALVGVPFYIFTKEVLGNTVSASIMILLMLPFFMFAMYEKDGMHLEQWIKIIITAKFKRPGMRPYKTDNMYRYLADEIRDKEVLGIGGEESTKNGFADIFGKGKKKDSHAKNRAKSSKRR